VNLVNFTLTVALVSVAYLGWIWVPLWLDNLDVKEALAAGVGQLAADVPYPPETVRAQAVAKLKRVGTHYQDTDGQQVEVPGLGVGPDDLQIDRDPDGRTIRLSVDYTRVVKLKPFDRYWAIPFHTSSQAVAHQ
jgi:hypothetical protein